MHEMFNRLVIRNNTRIERHMWWLGRLEWFVLHLSLHSIVLEIWGPVNLLRLLA